MNGSLAGRRARMTAGGSGTGHVIAERLAEAGARCMVCDVDSATLDEFAWTFGAGLGIRADVADEAQVDALFAQVEDGLGGVDILVNNAGISGPTLPAEQLSFGDWRRTLAVNLDAISYARGARSRSCARPAAAALSTWSSIDGRLGYPNRAAYATTK